MSWIIILPVLAFLSMLCFRGSLGALVGGSVLGFFMWVNIVFWLKALGIS